MSSQQTLFGNAQCVIPGGVNSPVRAFRQVGGNPLFIERAEGAYLYDVNGKRYIDYVGSWGPMIIGHAHPEVIHAVQTTAANGLSFGAPTELETKMAERLCQLVPSCELVRMVNSGTEATMSAIRLARGYTGRDKIIKFEGCYHGHSDALLVKAGSGALTQGVPDSLGVPADLAKLTITLDYNDIDQVHRTCQQIGHEIACIIVEPVAGNMNCVPPVPTFLPGLREICSKYGAMLIFDEVMTGFRVSLHGAQGLYGITPDLTTLGKVVGGGMPVGAFGGKREIMEMIAPLGPVYQAGTLSGNPVAMAAGLKTLDIIAQPGFYDKLAQTTTKLVDGLKEQAQANDIPLATHCVGGMFGLAFTSIPTITRFSEVMDCNVEHFKQFFCGLLAMGVNLAPSSFEAGFVSSAHSDDDIDATIDHAATVFKTIAA